MEESEPVQKHRRVKRRYWLGGVALVVAAGLGITWSQRDGIAASYIDDFLAQAEVQGGYDIREIGFGRQQIDNLVIGDPDNPDLTAASVEIYLRYGFGYPEIRRVVARGVRVNGRLVDGAFDFGQLNNLLPEPSGEPFSLPDMELQLTDAVLRLQTPYGPMALAATGSGSLPNGFRGFLAGASPGLSYQGCEIAAVRMGFNLAVTDRRPAIEGPAEAASLACADNGLSVTRPELAVNAIFSESFRRWGGDAQLVVASFEHKRAARRKPGSRCLSMVMSTVRRPARFSLALPMPAAWISGRSKPRFWAITGSGMAARRLVLTAMSS